MLILDKQKAVERVMALMTTASATADPEPPVTRSRRRTAQRIATYERRAAPETVAPPAVEAKPMAQKRRRVRPSVGPAPA